MAAATGRRDPAAVGVGVGDVGAVVAACVVVTGGAVVAVVVVTAPPTVKVVLAVASPSTQSTVTVYSPGSNPVVFASNDQLFAVVFPFCTTTVPEVPAAPLGADLFVGANPTGVTVTVRWLPGAMFVVPDMVTVSPTVTLPTLSILICCAAAMPQAPAASRSTTAIQMPPPAFMVSLSSISNHIFRPRVEKRIRSLP